MKERTLDKLFKLHVNTLDPLTSTCRDATYHSLCARIFKEDQYIRHVRYGSPTDVSVKSLIVAYIIGTKYLGSSRYATMFDDSDKPFYDGIWSMICEICAPNSTELKPIPIVPDNKLYMLHMDPDITRFNIQNIVDEYVAHNIVNDGPYVTRNKVARDVLCLPDKWLSVHYQMAKRDGRPLPLDKLLTFMFSAYRLAHQKYDEPRPGFWLEYATYAWQRVHYDLIDDLEAAIEYRKQYLLEDAGVSPKKITFRTLLK